MQRECGRVKQYRRRAGVVVQVAVMSTLIMGMGALTIDLGSMYTVQTDLQVAADAAALAGAAQLAGANPQADARAAAIEFASANAVMGGTASLNTSDVEFGRSLYDTRTQKYTFQPGGTNFDALRVTVYRGPPARGGTNPVAPLFGGVFGAGSKDLKAQAAAILIPRDIAVVIDLSGSMNDDSELRHYKQYRGDQGDLRNGIQTNLRDIWCALNGPGPSRPYVPGAENETEYAGDTGPAIGAISTWGDPVLPETYAPTTDPGLWYIPRNTTCTVAAARTSLQSRGYSTDEIDCLLSALRDSSYSTQWRNRTAVILDLASWKSGRPGGIPGGNGDDKVQDSEVTWVAYPSFRVTWTWPAYLSYVASSSTAMYATNTAFRYRFGLKTFVNFLLENEAAYGQTNILWQTPEQPVRAVKDAVRALTDVITGMQSLDHMSLEIFAQTAHHEVNLTDTLQTVPNRLYQMQSGHYDSTTNMGAGLLTARAELSSPRARNSACKVIMLMSDGKPNINEYGQYVGDGNQTVNDWVLRLAQDAADQNIRIYTIGVGGDSADALMEQIAAIAHGQYFHAQGTPAQYADQLDLIFRTLGGRRPVALIQ